MCAIVGITGHSEAANLAYLGLHALQHRGQEGAGIVSTDGEQGYAHKRKGLVADIFNQAALQKLRGKNAIAHTRYSTTGGNSLVNLQPLMMKCSLGWVAVAHNGNLVNAPQISRTLEQEGAIFQSTNDTEVIIHLMARSAEATLEGALVHALKRVQGAYSLLVMNHEKLIAIRDPHGFRPLVMGRLDDAIVFASESTAFDLIGARYLREVAPGEMIVIEMGRQTVPHSSYPLAKQELKRCVFEHIYFARPDSTVFGESVHEMRKGLGRQLAAEQPAVGADVVIPVPDSGVPAAIGFSEASGIPFDMGIIRSHYIGRTFIEPQQSIRDFGVRLKLNAVSARISGKEIVVIDDSLVRGTTSRKLIKHLREAGARKIHLRITAPPTKHSCYYGIDTPTRRELLASHQSVEDIRQYIEADSLGYLSLNGLMSVVSKQSTGGYCHACFSGEYPTPVENLT